MTGRRTTETGRPETGRRSRVIDNRKSANILAEVAATSGTFSDPWNPQSEMRGAILGRAAVQRALVRGRLRQRRCNDHTPHALPAQDVIDIDDS